MDKRKLAQKQVDEICRIYDNTHNISETSRQTGHDWGTCDRYARLNRLHSGWVGKKEKRRMLYLYTHGDTKDCVSRVAREIGRDRNTVRKYLRKEGLIW